MKTLKDITTPNVLLGLQKKEGIPFTKDYTSVVEDKYYPIDLLLFQPIDAEDLVTREELLATPATRVYELISEVLSTEEEIACFSRAEKIIIRGLRRTNRIIDKAYTAPDVQEFICTPVYKEGTLNEVADKETLVDIKLVPEKIGVVLEVTVALGKLEEK